MNVMQDIFANPALILQPHTTELQLMPVLWAIIAHRVLQLQIFALWECTPLNQVLFKQRNAIIAGQDTIVNMAPQAHIFALQALTVQLVLKNLQIVR